MRIVMITRFYRNGQTTHVTDLCMELICQGHEVLLIMNQLNDPGYSRWLRQTKIPYITTVDPARMQHCIAKWLPHPHIIHNHSAHTISIAITLSRLLNIPSVTTVHYRNFGSRNLLAEQDAIILISHEMQQIFGSVPVPTYVVENGVPIPPAVPARPWRQQALFLAQATHDKERNFKYMTESLLEWGWEIHSAGSWHHEGIISHHWVHEVSSLLKQANLVVGTGRAIREAMVWGTSAWVLGAYSDGLVTPENVAELERTNFSGRSNKQAFSRNEAALYLKKPSPEKLQALGAFGRKHAKGHYSIQDMVDKLLVIYKACILKYS